MKRWLSSVVLLSVCIVMLAQNTRWSQKDCIYSDFKHGFSWQLPVLDWKLTTGNEKHTVFKVVETNTSITAFVNINPIDTNKGFSEDIFRIYDKMVQMEDQLENQAERVTGQKTIQSNRRKARFGGKNAIKRRYITELVDDRYNEPLRVITYTYTFIYNKAIWSVTLKCHKQVYDLLLRENLELEGIFKGFNLIHIQ